MWCPQRAAAPSRVMLWVIPKVAAMGWSCPRCPQHSMRVPSSAWSTQCQMAKTAKLGFFFSFFPLALIKSIGKKKRNKMCLFAFYFILIRLTIPVLSKCLFQHFPAKEFLSLFKMTFRNKFNFRVLSTSVWKSPNCNGIFRLYWHWTFALIQRKSFQNFVSSKKKEKK